MIEERTYLTFDEALTQHIGEFGRGQKQVVALASLLAIPNGLIFLLWVMVTTDPIENHQWRCVDPSNAACSTVYAAPNSQGFCELPADAWHWTNTDSLVSRLNLICSDAWKIQFANSLMFIGCIIGSGVFGVLSDKIGRKDPIFISTALAAVATLVSVAFPNYWFIAVMRLLAGMGATAQVQGIILLCMETTGPSYRGIAAVLQIAMFCVGEFVLVALAVLAPNWRNLTAAAGAICAAGLLLYPLLPESARWLMNQPGRSEEGLQILRLLAAKNKAHLPGQLVVADSDASNCGARNGSKMLSFISLEEQHQEQEEEEEEEGDVCISSSSNSTPHLQQSNSIPEGSQSGMTLSTVGSQARQAHHSLADLAKANDQESVSSTAAVAPAAAAAAGDKPVELLQFLKQPVLAARSAVMVFTWFTNYFTFYVIALTTGGLPGSIYVTFAVNVTGQLIATLLAGFLVDRLGRHNIIACSLLAGGAACWACANTPHKVAQIVLATIGQFGCTASLSVAPTYTAELYPTLIRSTILGICSKACRLGSFVAPFVIILGTSAGAGVPIFMPYMTCGSACVAAGLLVLFMPETLGRGMPESMKDLKQLQTVFSAKPWRDGGLGPTLTFLFRMKAIKEADAAVCNAAVEAGAKDVETQM